jgi:ADP-heptose:LPS heptosyltransferase
MKTYKLMRSGMGLGDALYLQAVARYFVKKGVKVKVANAWPDVFKPLGIEVVPFTRQGVDILAHYSLRKPFKDTNQFQDCCIQAGITEKVEFKLDWTIQNHELVESLKTDKKLLLVQMPRNPMGRTDGFGKELLPDCKVIQDIINQLKSTYTIALIGAGQANYNFEGIDIDLTNKTSVSDLLDVAMSCDAMLGYCSFIVPLAECLQKPLLVVWSYAGLRVTEPYIRTITPHKILHAKTSRYVIDNWETQQITDVVHESFLQ